MNFKKYFAKKIIPSYFMIVTFILIGMAVSAVALYGNIQVSVLTLFVPPVFGALGCLPLLLDFFFLKVKSSGFSLILYYIAELAMLECCILSAAYFLSMVDSLLTATTISLMVLAIFSVVSAIMYVQDKKFCDSLNDALVEYSDRQGHLQKSLKK